MPMLQVYRCPVCATETEPSNVQPPGWLTLNSTEGGDVFDKWDCLVTYAAQKKGEVANG